MKNHPAPGNSRERWSFTVRKVAHPSDIRYSFDMDRSVSTYFLVAGLSLLISGCSTGISGEAACEVLDQVNEDYYLSLESVGGSLAALGRGEEGAQAVFEESWTEILAGSIILSNVDTLDDGIAAAAAALAEQDYLVSDILLQMTQPGADVLELARSLVFRAEQRDETARLVQVSCALR